MLLLKVEKWCVAQRWAEGGESRPLDRRCLCVVCLCSNSCQVNNCCSEKCPLTCQRWECWHRGNWFVQVDTCCWHQVSPCAHRTLQDPGLDGPVGWEWWVSPPRPGPGHTSLPRWGAGLKHFHCQSVSSKPVILLRMSSLSLCPVTIKGGWGWHDFKRDVTVTMLEGQVCELWVSLKILGSAWRELGGLGSKQWCEGVIEGRGRVWVLALVYLPTIKMANTF